MLWVSTLLVYDVYLSTMSRCLLVYDVYYSTCLLVHGRRVSTGAAGCLTHHFSTWVVWEGESLDIVVKVEIWCRSGRNHNHRSPCLVGREGNQVSNVTGDLGYYGWRKDLFKDMFAMVNLVAMIPAHDQMLSQSFTSLDTLSRPSPDLQNTPLSTQKKPCIKQGFYTGSDGKYITLERCNYGFCSMPPR